MAPGTKTREHRRDHLVTSPAVALTIGMCVLTTGCHARPAADIDSPSTGHSLMREARYDDALAWFEQTLAEEGAASERSSDETARARLAVLQTGRGLALSRLRRRSEAVEAIRRARADLEALTSPDARRAQAIADVGLARVLNETGRSFDAVQPATRAVEWWSTIAPRTERHAEAECELGRALILTGQSADGRALLSECVDLYRAWDRADPRVVEALQRLR